MSNSLAEVVAAAMERLTVPGIVGWGLENPDPTLFTLLEMGAGGGCCDETCAHVSHDPWAKEYKLVPLAGVSLVKVVEYTTDADEEAWYVATQADERLWLRARSPRNYWSEVALFDEQFVPDWVLAKLGEGAQRNPAPESPVMYVDGNRERAERIANLPVQRHPLPQNPALLRGVHVRVVAPGPFAGKTGVVKGTLPPRSRLRTGIDIAYGVDHDDRSQACWYGALDLEILDPDEPRRLSLALARRAYPALAALPDDFDPCHDEAWQVADDPYRGEVLIGSDGRAYARG